MRPKAIATALPRTNSFRISSWTMRSYRSMAAPEQSTEPIRGTFMPMVARDGLHYGASIEMPKAGRYKLTYAIKPPSYGGLGRHADRATGVDAWWKPFEVSFDWDYPGPPTAQN